LERLALKKIHIDRAKWAGHFKTYCETTTKRDNELFWTEKFIVPAGLNSYALIAD
jgi:hypothetical protein